MSLNNMPLYSNPIYDKLYDAVIELFKDPVIKTDIEGFAYELYNDEIRDIRAINELIAFYGNMILIEENPEYELKTTRFNEKIFLSVDNIEYGGTISLIHNDYSYRLIVDKSDYFDHETLETYRESFRDHLRQYMIEVLEQLNYPL